LVVFPHVSNFFGHLQGDIQQRNNAIMTSYVIEMQ